MFHPLIHYILFLRETVAELVSSIWSAAGQEKTGQNWEQLLSIVSCSSIKILWNTCHCLSADHFALSGSFLSPEEDDIFNARFQSCQSHGSLVLPHFYFLCVTTNRGVVHHVALGESGPCPRRWWLCLLPLGQSPGEPGCSFLQRQLKAKNTGCHRLCCDLWHCFPSRALLVSSFFNSYFWSHIDCTH